MFFMFQGYLLPQPMQPLMRGAGTPDTPGCWLPATLQVRYPTCPWLPCTSWPCSTCMLSTNRRRGGGWTHQ